MGVIDIKFLYGGMFYFGSKVGGVDKLCYKKKSMYVKKKIDPNLISKIELESYLKEDVSLKNVSELWYCKVGMPLHNGVREIKMDKDIVDLCSSVGKVSVLEVYVICGSEVSPRTMLVEPKNMSISQPSSKPTQKPKTVAPPTLPCLAIIPVPTHRETPQTTKFIQPSKTDPNPLLLCGSGAIYDEDDDTDVEHDEDGDVLGSETSDDDFLVCEENIFGDSDEEENLFEGNVDKDVPDENIPAEDGIGFVEEDVFDVFIVEDVFVSSSSDEGKVPSLKFPEFNHIVDFNNKICLKEKMTFASNDVFRRDLKQYAIEHGFDFYYLHNDKAKVSAYCLNRCKCEFRHSRKKCNCDKVECDFKATARRMGKDGSFQLKTWSPEHQCGWQDLNTKVTSVWLAQKYLENYRDDPQWRIKSFIMAVRRDYMVNITYHQAWRARLRAIMQTQGYAPEQYGRVWDYAATIIKFNPGSTVYIKPEENTEQPEKPIFQRFYVCLQACKEGFKAGCRPIIGLDGCHLKGAYTGQVLSAVAQDGNDNIFPIAFAVVESEKKSSWCWFIDNLLRDIGGGPLTFISDRQKGLVEALKLVAPHADTRVCVRHLQGNFAKQWPGKSYKDAITAASKSSTLAEFEQVMQGIKEMDEKAYNYLMRQDPATWSLHGFRHYVKSDMLLNNGCESFNSCILPAREMSIISMCEWIRRRLMRMFINKRGKMAAHTGYLTPKASEKLNLLRIDSLYKCKCIGDGDKFEVECVGKTYVVDLIGRTCGCNMWDLTGLPCIHAICCIMKRRLKVEDYVSEYYTKDTYMKAYKLSVEPMPGKDQWEKTPYPPLQPPRLIIQPGRPKKSRNKEPGEKASTKKTRLRTRKNSCGNCGEEGHTRKSCKNPQKPVDASSSVHRNAAQSKGGRPKGPNTMPVNPRKRKYTRKEVRPDPIPHPYPGDTVPAQVDNMNVSIQIGNEDDYDVDSLILQEMNQPSTQPSQTSGALPTQPNVMQSLRPVSAMKLHPVRGKKKKLPNNSRPPWRSGASTSSGIRTRSKQGDQVSRE